MRNLMLVLLLAAMAILSLGCSQITTPAQAAAPVVVAAAAPAPVTAQAAAAPGISAQARKTLADGTQQLKAKQFDAAVASFQKAVALQPDLPQGYLTLGRAYSAMKDYDQTVAVLQQATKAIPNNVDLLVALGQAHTARGFHIDPRCGSPHAGIGASPGTKDDKALRAQWIEKSN